MSIETNIYHPTYTTRAPEMSATEILDTDPSVSLDVNIRKNLAPGETVDVNYPALRRTLHELDAPADNSNLKINFADKSNIHAEGWHSPNALETAVKFKKNNPKSMQTMLQHELGHYVDYLSNPTEENELRKYAIGQKAQKAINYLAPVNAATTIGVVATFVPQTKDTLSPSIMSSETYDALAISIEMSQYGTAAASLGVLALGGSFYLANKRERTARKAQRKKLTQVVSVSSNTQENIAS